MIYSLSPLAKKGIVFDGRAVLLYGKDENGKLDMDGYNRLMSLPEMAADAAVALITTQNNAIPAIMTTYIDPKVIEVLTAPLAATEIYPEVKKGDFTTEQATFLSVEYTGSMAPYGDYSRDGMAGSNVNFPSRQSFRFQTFTRYGDREVAVAAEAKLNYVSDQQTATANVCNRTMNDIYLYGVSGLQNYGLMNDPGLSVADVPTTGAVTSATLWSAKNSDEIYDDVLDSFAALNTQANGRIKMDDELTLALPTICMPHLLKQNTYGISVTDRLKKAFPKLKYVAVPEFATGSGNLLQLIATNVNSQPTAECAFSEKMRAHGVVRLASHFEEKKSLGGWGTIIYKPFCIVQKIGI